MASTKQGKSKATATKKAPAAKKAKATAARGGISQTVQPSAELAEIVGSDALTRADLTKKVWDYIKKNGLQDAKDRRAINADAKLKPIFGGKAQVSMFEMTKLVNAHVK